MKRLAIIGAGDLGQQIAHYATKDGHYDDVVFFDDFETSKTVMGFRVLGKIEEALNQFQTKQFDCILIGIGYKHLSLRKKLFLQLNGKIPFGKIVHSTTWIDSSAIIDDGCIIYPGCLIDAKTYIGVNTVINIGCTIAHDSKIGGHSFLSPRVAIAGFVNIAEKVVLGINCTIIDNISISTEVQIGAAANVIQSIEKAGVYVGNPAKLIQK